MKRQGTVSVMDLANEVDGLPSYYFSEQSFAGVEGINGDAVESKKYKKGTCSACAFACKLPTQDEERGVETEGPEFEVAMAFGSNSGVDDIVDVMQSNELCDRLGMDAISAGNTVAAYLASEDAFGDTDLIHETVEKIAHRDGIGDTLAEGIDRCYDDLGVENWTVKGMDFAAHEAVSFTARDSPTPSPTAARTTCMRRSTPSSTHSSPTNRRWLRRGRSGKPTCWSSGRT